MTVVCVGPDDGEVERAGAFEPPTSAGSLDVGSTDGEDAMSGASAATTTMAASTAPPRKKERRPGRRPSPATRRRSMPNGGGSLTPASTPAKRPAKRPKDSPGAFTSTVSGAFGGRAG